jgi:pyruvate,orthophosphate dikinase
MKTARVMPEQDREAVPLDGSRDVDAARFGARARRLARLAALGLPVPAAVAISAEASGRVADGRPPAPALPEGLIAVRASPGEDAWGGPEAMLFVGAGEAGRARLALRIGHQAALEVERQAVLAHAARVAGLPLAPFEALAAEACAAASVASPGDLPGEALHALLLATKRLFAAKTGTAFPEDRASQLAHAVRTMRRDWASPSAVILRRARGAPEDASLPLILQEMILDGAGPAPAGRFQAVDPRTGGRAASGWVMPAARARGEAIGSGRASPEPVPTGADREAWLFDACASASVAFGDAMALDVAIGDRGPFILDAVPARRSARASIRIAVDLVRAGAIARRTALLRIDPLSLVEHLHPSVDPEAERRVIASGLAASPGAAAGPIYLSAGAALAGAARGEPGILVRPETGPDDIRGMHASRGVVTLRGGMTSHAAVIARGLGLPCIVGAGSIRLAPDGAGLLTAEGRHLAEGSVVTLDGTGGEILDGMPDLIPAAPDAALRELLGWADEARALGVRANADSPAEARLARDFGAEGIGLCRTEHMFFAEDRITVMGEMILAARPEARQAALDRLLPMQRADFEELFAIMEGLPVTIRLLDPPLHEFLPRSAAEMDDLAARTALTIEEIRKRIEDLSEFNPMLGLRGVRLGITVPEIYEMQARAIFEAAVASARRGAPVAPEIMIPLVSANREVEMVKNRIDAVARAVAAETGHSPDYRIGVMVETPRAALRAGDLAASSAFLSFGTNDLTQMTFGLSRDDAGRFMRAYVGHGLFREDPFHSLDLEGVGELMLIAARRGRVRNPALVLGLCGEHGGDPASIRFCKLAGFDYVSCSPFRVPIARLAAAQATILAARDDEATDEAAE